MRFLIVLFITWWSAPLWSVELPVAPGESIQDALGDAMPGDVVVVQAGTYNEAIETVRDGTADSPITLRGDGAVVIQTFGRVVDVQHAYVALEGITVDGDYGDRDAIRVGDDGNFLILRSVEVRRSGRDCIDMGSVDGVQILDSHIHHCLNWDGERVDAHGVTGASVTNLTIRNTEIHTFTGDAIQFDPGRSAPGWNRIEISDCAFWLAPLEQEENGVPAGTVPGENAIDTKTNENAETAQLIITNTIAYGFRNGLISNMAVYNIKENVAASFDGVQVWDSEIAFRLRGATGSVPNGSSTRVVNAVVYDVDTVVRYEDDLQDPIVLYNVTLGRNIGRAFQNASAPDGILDVRNVVSVDALPDEVSGSGNVQALATDFVDLDADDYRPVEGATFIDVGEDLMVAFDLRGVPRPFGDGVDSGAYEFTTEPIEPRPPANNSVNNANNAENNSANTNNGDGPEGSPDPSDTSGCCASTGTPRAPTLLLIVIVCAFARRRRIAD